MFNLKYKDIIEILKMNKYDLVVHLDADNLINPEFLNLIKEEFVNLYEKVFFPFSAPFSEHLYGFRQR